MVIFYVRQRQMEPNNKRIAIIGNGSWATALVHTLSENYSRDLPDHETHLFWWIRKAEDIDFIQKNKCNPRYLKDLKLNLANIALHSDLQYVIDKSDIVIITIPTQYIPETFQDIDFRDKIVVNASKGMTTSPSLLVSEFMERCGVDKDHYAVISGPSHAEEVAENKTTYLTIASENLGTACTIRFAFASPRITGLIFRMSTDVKGIEIAGIIKNVYAIGMGLISQQGENFKAAYLSNCACEMNNILEQLYPGEKRCVLTSPYLGDLMVTGYSSLSRNFRFGELLSKGYSVIDAKAKIGQEVAGVSSVNTFIDRFAHIHITRNQCPILTLLYQVINDYLDATNFVYHLQELIS